MRGVVATSMLLAASLLSTAVAQTVSAPALPLRDRIVAAYSNLSSAEKREVAALGQGENRVASIIQADEASKTEAFAALNFSELLTPEFRQRDGDGSATSARLEKARTLLKQERDIRNQSYDEMAHLISSSNLPADMKSLYQERLSELLSTTKSVRDRLFGIASDEIDLTGKIANLIGASKWMNEGGRYSFESPTVAQKFEADIARLNSLAREAAADNAELAALTTPW